MNISRPGSDDRFYGTVGGALTIVTLIIAWAVAGGTPSAKTLAMKAVLVLAIPLYLALALFYSVAPKRIVGAIDGPNASGASLVGECRRKFVVLTGSVAGGALFLVSVLGIMRGLGGGDNFRAEIYGQFATTMAGVLALSLLKDFWETVYRILEIRHSKPEVQDDDPQGNGTQGCDTERDNGVSG